MKIISKEKIDGIYQRVTENINLKSVKVLKEFNELIVHYDLTELKKTDFEKVKRLPEDDLPF